MFLLRKPTRGRRARQSTAPRAHLGVELLETRTVPYALSGNAWVHPELVTISFVPDGTDLGGVQSNLFATLNARYSQSYWQGQFLKAAQVWAKETNLNFALKADTGSPIGNGSYQQGSPSFGDIRIGGYNFGTSTLARAYLPPQVNNFSIAGDFQFNTGQSWVIGSSGGYDIFTVAMHEFGHALGLYHSSNYYAAMYPSYRGARSGLGSDDQGGIRAIYSSSQARAQDSYDAASSNGALSTATNIQSLINTQTLTGLVTDRDITSSTDVDYYRFSVPSGTTGTMTVKLQSSGLSLLEPYLMLYNASGQAISYTDTTGTYGTTLTTTITGVQAGQTYYVRAGADDCASPFGTGKYALTLNFGSSPSPTVPLPNTLTANGTPLSSGGGTPEEDGLEFRVNSITDEVQTTDRGYAGQAMAMDASGNSVITWSSEDQDGDGWGVYAQRYNSASEAQGGAFQVNTTTAGDQKHAAVAMGGDGNFVITWSSRNQDGDGWDIYARSYSAAGQPLGGELGVNVTTTGDQSYSSVAMDADGDFVITWSSRDGNRWDVHARRYSAAGQPLGGAFQVNTTTTGDQKDASAAMGGHGDFVVTWSSEDQDGNGWGVYAQRYDAAGVAQGTEFQVNTTTTGDQQDASVAMGADGNFVVTWSSNGQDGSGWGIYAQRYDATGAAQGSEFQVNTTTENDQVQPAVAASRGTFVVTWSSKNQDGDGWGVYAQRFGNAGQAVGGELRVNTTTQGDQYAPSVASSDFGNFVVVWNGRGPGDSTGVFAQRYVVYAGDEMGGVGDAFRPDGCGDDHDHDSGCGCAGCQAAVSAASVLPDVNLLVNQVEGTGLLSPWVAKLLEESQDRARPALATTAADWDWLRANDACFAKAAWIQ